MMRLVKALNSNEFENEHFTTGSNYYIIDGKISDDNNNLFKTFGTELYQYTEGHSFYVYSRSEVQELIDNLVVEIDGIPSLEQEARLQNLQNIIDEWMY